MMAVDSGDDSMPVIEAEREVIEHFNKHRMSGFDRVGYFILDNVVVCEKGKKEEIKDKMERSDRMDAWEALQPKNSGAYKD